MLKKDKKEVGRASPRAPSQKARSGTPEEAIRKRRLRLMQAADIRSFFTRLVVMAALIWVMLGVCFGIRPMANEDMKPRISAGDLMLYYRLQQRYVSGDVIVFSKNGRIYTGRIAAKGGDTVEISDENGLKINGSSMIESDIFYRTSKYDSDVTYPVSLADDEFFILCDYRQGAKDSRYFGPVKREEIEGKVITVIRRSNL